MTEPEPPAPPASPPTGPAADTLPLCVDLDDTLVRTDTLLESVFAVLGRNPLRLLALPFLLLSRGRAGFKRALAAAGGVSAAHLPYREDLVEHLRAAKAGGRTLVLATASDRAWADAVADHLGVFDEVLASDGERNLKSAAKADALVARYGEKGFVYAGDAKADLAVWARAGGAVLAGRGTRLERRLPEGVGVEARFPDRGGGPRALARALRPYQWAKNVLVFVPPLAAHVLHQKETLVAALLLFARLLRDGVRHLRAERPARPRGGSQAPPQAPPPVRERKRSPCATAGSAPRSWCWASSSPGRSPRRRPRA